MSLISTMKPSFSHGTVKGYCAKCSEPVFESLAMLDDAYNVWLGRCPHCNALNFLALTGLRGYSTAGMNLVLPTEEEKISNGLPDCPTRPNPRGGKTMIHGSNSGEICHHLREGKSLDDLVKMGLAERINDDGAQA